MVERAGVVRGRREVAVVGRKGCTGKERMQPRQATALVRIVEPMKVAAIVVDAALQSDGAASSCRCATKGFKPIRMLADPLSV